MSEKWNERRTIKVWEGLEKQIFEIVGRSRVRVSFNAVANMAIERGINIVKKEFRFKK